MGCDPDQTYFDVPPDAHLDEQKLPDVPHGVRFSPARDTWYSAPTWQINWWLRDPSGPCPPMDVAFHPAYSEPAGEERCSIYNYDEWTRSRARGDQRTQSRRTPVCSRNPKSRWSSTRRSGSCPAGRLILLSQEEPRNKCTREGGGRTSMLGTWGNAEALHNARRFRVHGTTQCGTIFRVCGSQPRAGRTLSQLRRRRSSARKGRRLPLLVLSGTLPALRGRPSNAPTKRANHRRRRVFTHVCATSQEGRVSCTST